MNIPDEMLKTVLDTYELAKSPGDFGVEIELEGRRITCEVAGWDVHKEGSLRGEGVEYVTKGAVTEKTLTAILANLNRTLIHPNRQIIPSNRTSTHIHLNMQDVSIIDVFGYFVVYTTIEPLLFRIHAPMRDGNLFCQSAYDSGDAAQAVANALAQGPNAFYDFREKYASLNLLPLTKFGSVECRIFPSTIEADKILQWCKILRNIKDFVEKSDRDFFGIVNNARTNPDVLIEEIFGIEATPEYRELIQFGTEQSYEMAREIRRFLLQPQAPKPVPKERYSMRDMDGLVRNGRAKVRAGFAYTIRFVGNDMYELNHDGDWIYKKRARR